VTDLHRLAGDRLAAYDGQRYTRGRRRIVATLADIGEPATTPTILRHAQDLTQSSLYRNLAVLVSAGLVTKLSIGEEHAYYELSEELTEHHHHHLVCRSCNRVTDITLSKRAEQLIDKALAEIAGPIDFEIDAHRLDLVGHCTDCAARLPAAK
jgi:Fur family ferric uptake transcriptional regulator